MWETEPNQLNYQDFPRQALSFAQRASHHSTCCARQSLTSYWPVVHACSHCRERWQHCGSHMQRETARAPQQVPQHFSSTRANGSLFALPVVLISFTSYGADWMTQEFKPNCLRNWDFLNFCLVGPPLVPKQNSRFQVFCCTICWLWWSINIYETFGAKKSAVSLWNLVSVPCSETGPNFRTLGSGPRYQIL